jgi:hypothetical protein
MIANCSTLITQYSTVVYTGIALGKEVHSYFDVSDAPAAGPAFKMGGHREGISRPRAVLCSRK